MRGAFTQYPGDLPQTVQMNAGFIAATFDPETGEYDDILGATSDGITFNPNPTYEDFGADIDNVPANTWQMKRLTAYDPTASGTFKTMTAALAKRLLPGSDFATGSTTHIIPTSTLTAADFDDIWIIGDYSDVNTGANAGYMAIHLMSAMNNTSLQWKTNKDGKADFAFEFHAHYDLTSPDTVPFEVYVKPGTAATAGGNG